MKSEGIVNVLGLQQLDDIITIPYRELKASQQVIWFIVTHVQWYNTCFCGSASMSGLLQALMKGLKVSPQYPKGRANRAIFCSRTLNLRSIQAIGDCVCTAFKWRVKLCLGQALSMCIGWMSDACMPCCCWGSAAACVQLTLFNALFSGLP